MKSSLSRSVDELRQRTAEAFSRLGLVPGTSLAGLLKVVADVSGRRIEIDPVGTRECQTGTGRVVLSAGEARVLIRKSDPRWYQFHSMLHELSHLVLEHTGCSSLPSGRAVGVTARPGQTILARSATQMDFESGIDFSDPESVREAEAEKLSQAIARVMLGPKHAADEAVLG